MCLIKLPDVIAVFAFTNTVKFNLKSSLNDLEDLISYKTSIRTIQIFTIFAPHKTLLNFILPGFPRLRKVLLNIDKFVTCRTKNKMSVPKNIFPINTLG